MPRFSNTVGMCELFAADSLTKVTKSPSLTTPAESVGRLVNEQRPGTRRAAALCWAVKESLVK